MIGDRHEVNIIFENEIESEATKRPTITAKLTVIHDGQTGTIYVDIHGQVGFTEENEASKVYAVYRVWSPPEQAKEILNANAEFVEWWSAYLKVVTDKLNAAPDETETLPF